MALEFIDNDLAAAGVGGKKAIVRMSQRCLCSIASHGRNVAMVFRPAMVAATAALLLLAACDDTRDSGGTVLRIDLITTPGGHELDKTITSLTDTGLVGLNEKAQVVPALATSWRITHDNRSAIFRLRNRTWPDGRAVTAADVVASFRHKADMNIHNPFRHSLMWLANGAGILSGSMAASSLGVGSPADNVVEVTASGSMPSLLALLAQPDFAISSSGLQRMSLGSMHIVDVSHRPIILLRNRDVTMASGPAPTIALLPAADPGPAVARFAHNRTDLVIGNGLAGLDDARLLAASNVLRVEPTWGVYGYLVRATGSLADVRVRRALAMSINREELGKRLFGTELTPVLGLIPPLPSEPVPTLPDWALQAPPARFELARQLLAAAGFDAARPFTIAVSVSDAREHASVAGEVAADWGKIGVRTRIIVRSPQGHADAVARGDYELALVERMTPVDNPIAFLLPFVCRPKNYCNPGADALIAAARTAPDAESASTAALAAEAALIADTPMITLFAPVRWALVSPRITGWSANAAGQHPLALLGISRNSKHER